MMPLLLSFGAGLLTVLAPCVLPLLPIVVASSRQQHRLGPLALGLGMVSAFTLMGMAVATIGARAGFDVETVRHIAAWLMLGSALVLLSRRLQAGVARCLTPLANAGNRWARLGDSAGLLGQLLLGMLLGVIWSPCVGPTLGATLGLAAAQQQRSFVVASLLLYGMGAALPLVVLAYGSRRWSWLSGRLRGAAHGGKYALAVVLLGLGAAIITGADRWFEARLLNWLPAVWVRWTTIL